ncbi:MAG: hypothetical protein PHQ81_07460, partial [Methanofollis sp.]|nr:hypothetical protein [Methanofollis sp.]
FYKDEGWFFLAGSVLLKIFNLLVHSKIGYFRICRNPLDNCLCGGLVAPRQRDSSQGYLQSGSSYHRESSIPSVLKFPSLTPHDEERQWRRVNTILICSSVLKKRDHVTRNFHARFYRAERRFTGNRALSSSFLSVFLPLYYQ